MKTEIFLGRCYGLAWSARPSAFAGALALWVLLAIIAGAMLKLPIDAAIAAGLAAMLLHWLSEAGHQLGHAWAARRTGHPMTGVCFWAVLGASRYPAGEGALPDAVHVRRALGGPFFSLALTIVAGALALALHPEGGPAWWLALFAFLENLLVFTLQAAVPLGFNDGAVLWQAWRRRQ